MQEENPGSLWEKSRETNLVRYVPSGVYFARARVGGKLIRKSLRTKKEGIAKLRLADLINEERRRLQKGRPAADERMTFAQAKELYLERLAKDPKIKPRTREYRHYCLHVLAESWPGLDNSEVKKITEAQCRDWAEKFSRQYAATVYNNTVGTLRLVLDIGIEKGICFSNAAKSIQRVRVPPREVALPEPEAFRAIVEAMRTAYGRFSRDCADLVEFLVFTGCRKSEAARVTWNDVEFDKGELVIRGDLRRGARNGAIRRVPMIPDARRLLSRMRRGRRDEPGDNRILRVRECQKSLDRACKIAGVARLTHHDLRHLFAAR